MKKVGIIGGAGYTAGELLRLLINHPEVSIGFIHSTSNAGRPVTEVHEGLLGETDLVFSDSHPLEEVDVLFLCSAHGHSRAFWEENKRLEGLKVPPMLAISLLMWWCMLPELPMKPGLFL